MSTKLGEALLTPAGKVLLEVSKERVQQDAKWGEQNHPDGTGARRQVWQPIAATNAGLRNAARTRCDLMHRGGHGTWEHILTEEYAEALAESDPKALRAELVQLAAVAVAWVEAIDRREKK